MKLVQLLTLQNGGGGVGAMVGRGVGEPVGCGVGGSVGPGVGAAVGAQLAALHGRAVDMAGQATPPNAAAVISTREHGRTPLPHTAVHAPHDHTDATQSAGHCCMPQFWCARSAGHATPPYRARLSALRERVANPPPQLAVHGDHAPHAPTAQLREHGATLHCARCASVGQTEPARLRGARCSTVRARACVPPPQDFEQPPNAPHADTEQRTGQRPALQ